MAGSPKHKPTKETRLTVKTLASVGTSQARICRRIGIGSKNTLEKYYRKELDEGMDIAVINMEKSFYMEALNSHDWRAKVRWLRLFGGPQWKEAEQQKVELTGAEDAPLVFTLNISGDDDGYSDQT